MKQGVPLVLELDTVVSSESRALLFAHLVLDGEIHEFVLSISETDIETIIESMYRNKDRVETAGGQATSTEVVFPGYPISASVN